MTRALIKKLITNDYDSLTFEEIKLIISNPKVFPIKKTDKQALEKLVSKPSDENRDTAIKVLRAILPSPFELLKNIDKYSIREEDREFNFRDQLLRNLHRMNNMQLCVFIDKVIKFGKDGIKSEGYLIIKRNGEVLKTTKIRTDKYNPIKTVIMHGTAKKEQNVEDISLSQ